jgi:hypothetical protein
MEGAMYVALSKSSTDDESINNWRRFLLNRPASPASQAILHSAVSVLAAATTPATLADTGILVF